MIYINLLPPPILQVDDYFSLTEESLHFEFENFYKNRQSYNLSELDFEYWKSRILENVIDSDPRKRNTYN